MTDVLKHALPATTVTEAPVSRTPVLQRWKGPVRMGSIRNVRHRIPIEILPVNRDGTGDLRHERFAGQRRQAVGLSERHAIGNT